MSDKREALISAGRRADDRIPKTNGYGVEWADEFMAALFGEGYQLAVIEDEPVVNALSASADHGSVAAMLDNDADAAQAEVSRLSHRIEVLEREIVEARADREQEARRMAELRTAANILREVGLRSSIVKGVPLVEVDYQPKRPVAGRQVSASRRPKKE